VGATAASVEMFPTTGPQCSGLPSGPLLSAAVGSRDATQVSAWFASTVKTLNECQLRLLQRIVEGGYRAVSSDATTIYALRRRRLVSTETAYAYATVQATEAGRALVEHQRSIPVTPGTDALGSDSAGVMDVAPSPAALVELLTRSADHRLVVSDPNSETRAAWRRLLYATRREQTAGGDVVLRHTGRARGDLVIWLEPRIEADVTSTSVASVEVPDRVRRPHLLISELRHITVGYRGWIDTHRLPDVAHVRISPASKQRAIRILHALALEAQRRGHTVESTSSDNCPGGFGINIDGHVHELTIVEHYRRIPHVLTAREQAVRDRGGFDWAPRWDHEATGRLVLRHGHGTYASPLAGDRARWKVEVRLGHVMDQLEQLSIVAAQRRLAQVERQQREAARRELKQQATEDAWLLRERVRRLDAQIEQWEHATRIRRFVEAARPCAETDESSHDWLDWANSFADSIDPIIAGLVSSAWTPMPSQRPVGRGRA
jgi:hypothetical protein